jgi:RNA polymerase sigma factor (sigma-70 family)
VERLSRHVCRGARLNPADVDDFVSHVAMKLVEDDYAVLRRFEGRCTISSFLIVVIRRALSDYQAHLFGKFRPSAEAERLGPEALMLESLLQRDGRSLDEAVSSMQAAGRTMTRPEAERIAARLPERRVRPRYVEIDEEGSGVQLSVTTERMERELGRGDRATTSSTVSATLRQAIGHLPAEDQTLLRLKFLAGWSVADIARSTRIDQQQLYARLRRICRSLRAELVGAGIDAARVNDIIGQSDVDLDFGLDQNPVARPSSEPERDRKNEEEAVR